MKVQSYSDIITNSSSELFVFDDNKSVDEVIKELDGIYPDWRNEYQEPEKLKDSEDGADTMFRYSIGYNMKHFEEAAYCERNGILPTFESEFFTLYDVDLTKDDFDRNLSYAKKIADELGDTPEKVFSNWDKFNPFATWDDEKELGLTEYLDLSDYGLELYKKKHAEDVLVWSLGENPDWDYQEKMSEIANRYHLG